jgi:hypothetical protein
MEMAFDRRLTTLVAGVLVFLGAGVELEAKTLTLDKEECFVDVPEYWEVHNLAADHVTIVSPDHYKFFLLQASKAAPNITVDNSNFLGHVEKGLVLNGFTVTTRKMGSLCGYRAQIFDVKKVEFNRTSYARETVVMANARVYLLYEATIGYPADQDDELSAIVGSFGLSVASQKSNKNP